MLVRAERSVYTDFKKQNDIANSVHSTIERNISKWYLVIFQLDAQILFIVFIYL